MTAPRWSDFLPDPELSDDQEPVGTGPRNIVSDQAAEAFHQSHPVGRFRCALCSDDQEPENTPARLPLWEPRRWKGLVMAWQPMDPTSLPRGGCRRNERYP